MAVHNKILEFVVADKFPFQLNQMIEKYKHAGDYKFNFIAGVILTWPALMKEGPKSHRRFLSCRARFGTTS